MKERGLKRYKVSVEGCEGGVGGGWGGKILFVLGSLPPEKGWGGGGGTVTFGLYVAVYCQRLSLMSQHLILYMCGRVPTQIAFSNSLCFPCLTVNFPCANLRGL